MNGDRGALSGHSRLVIILVVIASVVVASAAYVQAADSTIIMINPEVSFASQYYTTLNIPSMGDIYIMGHCPPANYSTTCEFSLSVSMVRSDLYAKSITMKVTNAILAQPAIESGGNPSPAFQVLYGEDGSGFKYATAYFPSASPGAYAFIELLVLNAPTFNGRAYLGLTFDVQVGSTSVLSHSYDLRATIQLPAG